ncbi:MULTISPECIES: helix-turn-helix domain-containing protein [Mesorhizobium]|uniref:helix-turn-helix domain-containing protein n=1 Tax=Mesorhizobium TaxID=68287 RepID=UPI0010A96161|nr:MULTISPECIES: helix-turn-helix domain-containing protein [Mesorhizobium]
MGAVDFIPISQLSARHSEGWRLVQPLEPDDYAALMQAPGMPESNKHLAAVARNQARFGQASPRQAKRQDRLDDEVHELRERLAAFSGGDDLQTARRRFGLNKAEATIFMMLVQRGVASYDHLASALYSFDALERIDDLGEAIRSHVKRLRRKLKPHGPTFTTSYGFGFEMSEPQRSAAKVALADARVPA